MEKVEMEKRDKEETEREGERGAKCGENKEEKQKKEVDKCRKAMKTCISTTDRVKKKKRKKRKTNLFEKSALHKQTKLLLAALKLHGEDFSRLVFPRALLVRPHESSFLSNLRFTISTNSLCVPEVLLRALNPSNSSITATK